MKSQPILPFLPTTPSGDRPGTAVPGVDPGFAKTLDRHRRMPGPSRPAPVEPRRTVEPPRAERRPEPAPSREPERRPEPKRTESSDRSARGEPVDRHREAESRGSTADVEDKEPTAEAATETESRGEAEETPATTAESQVEDGSADPELAVESPGSSLATLPAGDSEAVAVAEPAETADMITEGEGVELTSEPETAVDPSIGTEQDTDTEVDIEPDTEVGMEADTEDDKEEVDLEAGTTTMVLTETPSSAAGEAQDAPRSAGAGTEGSGADAIELDVASATHDSSAPAGEAIAVDLTVDGGQEDSDGSPSTPLAPGERPVTAAPAAGSAGPTVAIPTVGPTPDAPVAPPVTAAVPGSTTAAAATGTTAWEQVGTSIASTVRTLQDGSHRLLLRLYPKELGSVVLELTVSGERVDVRLLAQQAGTRDLLSQTAGELRQDLGQNGLTLGSMDVDLERGPESGATHDEGPNGDSGLRFGDGPAPSGRPEPRPVVARRSDSSLDLDL